jgi:hypothetical protein
VLGEAGLAAHDARPRPRQTEAKRRHPAGGRPGSGHGSPCHGPHLDREAVPGHVRMRLYTLPGWRSRSPPLAPMTRAGRRTVASRGAKWVRRMSLFDNRGPRIVVLRRMADLRRRWRYSSRGDRVRVGRRRWGLRPAASGPAAGPQAGFLAVLRLIIRLARRAITLRPMTRIGGHRPTYSAGFPAR